MDGLELVQVSSFRRIEIPAPVTDQDQAVVLCQRATDPVHALRTLVRIRVRPYYLYQAQTLKGTEHFIVPIEKGVEIIRNLRGFTTGFAEPKYVLDTPYGKIPMGPKYMKGRDGDDWILQSYDGRIWHEYNPLTLDNETHVED